MNTITLTGTIFVCDWCMSLPCYCIDKNRDVGSVPTRCPWSDGGGNWRPYTPDGTETAPAKYTFAEDAL